MGKLYGMPSCPYKNKRGGMIMAKEKKVRIQVMMKPKLVHLIDQIADESEVSRSNIIEIAVLHLIKTAKDEDEKKGKA